MKKNVEIAVSALVSAFCIKQHPSMNRCKYASAKKM